MEIEKEIRKKQKLTKYCKFFKKLILMSFTFAASACLFSIQAFAADASTFLNDAVDAMKTVVTLIGGGLAVWGIVNLLEAYGNDNAGAKSQGIKQLMAGVGIILIAQGLIPKLKDLFVTAGGGTE